MTIASSDVNDLRELSAKLGHNARLVQAASGNTSLKQGGTMWIKASGKWMADAKWAEIFVPVDLETLERQEGTLAPSIETAMHAVLPRRVVVHVHSVNTIAWAVREDGQARLSEKLGELPWAWIPYSPSGVPLACEIQLAGERCAGGFPDIFVLANHGLVIAADSCNAAERLLAEVERRLEVVPRESPAANRSQLNAISRGTGFHAPAEAEVHFLGTDALSRSILLAGTLYPCHAMFLGRAAAECKPFESVTSAVERYEQQYGTRPTCIAVSGEGLLVTDSVTVTQMQVLIGLTEVIQRIPPGAPVRYLTDQEISELMTTDAHQYRANVEARAALSVR